MSGFTKEQKKELEEMIAGSNQNIAEAIESVLGKYAGQEEPEPYRGRERRPLAPHMEPQYEDDYYDDYEDEYYADDEGDELPYYIDDNGYLRDSRSGRFASQAEVDELLYEAGYEEDEPSRYADEYDEYDDYDDYEDYDDYDDDDLYASAEQDVLDEIRAEYEDRLAALQEKNELRAQMMEEKLQAMEERDQELMQRHIQERAQVELSKALDKAQVTSIDAGLKWFADNIVYDEDSDKILFEKDGEFVSVDEGLKGNIPRWLKASKGQPGAGSLNYEGGSPEDEEEDEYLAQTQPQIPDEVANLEAKVKEATERATRSQQDSDIGQAQALTMELRRVRQEMGAPRPTTTPEPESVVRHPMVNFNR